MKPEYLWYLFTWPFDTKISPTRRLQLKFEGRVRKIVCSFLNPLSLLLLIIQDLCPSNDECSVYRVDASSWRGLQEEIYFG